MKKKMAVIALCGIFILYTSACGQSDNSSTSSDTQSQNTGEEAAETKEDERMTNECLDGTGRKNSRCISLGISNARK